MPEQLKHLLVFVLIIGLFVVGIASVPVYSYLHSLNEKNALEKERITMEERTKSAELQHKREIEETDQKNKDKAEAAANQRHLNLIKCLADAQEKYSQNWDSTCASMNDSQRKRYLDCVDYVHPEYTGDDAIKFCLGIWPPIKEKDCQLSPEAAKRWDDFLTKDKNACALQYK